MNKKYGKFWKISSLFVKNGLSYYEWEKIRMNTTLIIMVAGIGSRFGEGIKQLVQMGSNGEIIMDHSMHDAKEVEFNQALQLFQR